MNRNKKLRSKRRTFKKRKFGGTLDKDNSKETRKSRQQLVAEAREAKKAKERADRMREETEKRQRRDRRKTLKKAREQEAERIQQETRRVQQSARQHTGYTFNPYTDIVSRELAAAEKSTDPDMRSIHLANAQMWMHSPAPPPPVRILFPPFPLAANMKNSDGSLDTRSDGYINWVWTNYVSPQVTQVIQQTIAEHSNDSPQQLSHYVHMAALSSLTRMYRENIETPDGMRRIPGQALFGLEKIINSLYGTTRDSTLVILTNFYMTRPELINQKVINRLTEMYKNIDQRENLTIEQQMFLERILGVGSGSGM